MIFSSTVHPPFKPGTALVSYLTARFTYHDLDAWLGHITSGRIACNGLVAGTDATVSPGDVVSYDPGEFEEPKADLNYRVVYEDQWLLGIDKPANLLVHRAGKSVTNNLMYQLRYSHVPPWPEAHSVHRLDRDTSGVLIVAKDAAAMAALADEREFNKKFNKLYYAVVVGTPPVGDIDLPLGKPNHSAIPYKFCVTPGGKPSITRILARQQLGRDHSLLTLRPVTGRTHQIRVHLDAIGTPVVGDKLYGRSEEEYLAWRDDPASATARFGFPRHALHCASMTFTHPCTNNECRIEAPMPGDMRGLIASLSG